MQFPRPLSRALLGAVLAISMPALTKNAEAQNAPVPLPEAQRISSDKVRDQSLTVVLGDAQQRKQALDFLVQRGKMDVVPSLVLYMRLSQNNREITSALKKLTGEDLNTWKDAMLWQEAHPEVVPHESYREIKLGHFANIDPNFLQFFDPKTTHRDKMKIRLEEITWGGVRVDGIPSLDNPTLITIAEADYLRDDDLVFGVEINGDVRAYPLRIMGWHEMFNEVIGGVPVALAYCTLCGAGILFETKIEGRKKPLIFGSSGFLYRSNKLMFDRETNSLWNQFTGEPVSGKLVDKGLKLKIRPVTITSWGEWKTAHPDTRVLSLDIGHKRDYGSGVVYNDYFASPDLMFPTTVRDESEVKRKEYVFGIREFGAAKAWPVKAFKRKRVINDRVGATDVVLIGDAKTRTVRAYQRDGQSFKAGRKSGTLKGPGGIWSISEDFVTGPNGEKLPRVPGHVAYWFAWDGYLGLDSDLYKG
ncbi:MAG: DUF3179 domain-containing protein [Stappiaceae bacterium]